jgi:hypothetical protein
LATGREDIERIARQSDGICRAISETTTARDASVSAPAGHPLGQSGRQSPEGERDAHANTRDTLASLSGSPEARFDVLDRALIRYRPPIVGRRAVLRRPCPLKLPNVYRCISLLPLSRDRTIIVTARCCLGPAVQDLGVPTRWS